MKSFTPSIDIATADSETRLDVLAACLSYYDQDECDIIQANVQATLDAGKEQ